MARIEAEINDETITEGKAIGDAESPIENNLILSTIEDFLEPFKDDGTIVNDSYDSIVNALFQYIKTGKFPSDIEAIKVGKTNRKRLGWAINRLLKGEGIGIEYELLQFAKQYISIYSKYELDETGFRKGTLYKNFTTKTK